MSKTLFEEAVADANKLRSLAEETAKNRVVEAVMPQIRDLVNRKILGEELDLQDLESSPEDELVDDLSPLPQGEDLELPDENAADPSRSHAAACLAIEMRGQMVSMSLGDGACVDGTIQRS